MSAHITTTASSVGGSPLTYPINCPAGTTILVIITSSIANPSSITYGGGGINGGQSESGFFFGDNWVTVSYIYNPPTGSSINVVVDTTPNPSTIYSSAHALTGTDTTNPLDTSLATFSTDTTITTVYDDSLIFSNMVQFSNTITSPTTSAKYGATEILNTNPAPNDVYGSSWQLGGMAGVQNVGWTDVTGRPVGDFHCAMVIVTFKSAPPPVSNGSFLVSMLNKKRKILSTN